MQRDDRTELTPETYDSKHLIELQSIRGLAALVVLLHHCSFYYRYDLGVRMWFERILNAHAAVVLFYVLSGYVLTLAIFRKPISTENTLRFYVRRIFRIYPALLVACCLGLAYIVAFHGQPLPAQVSSWWPDYYRLAPLRTVSIIATFLGAGHALPLPIWSIFIELIGSLILPLIAFSIHRRRVAFFVLTTALLLVSLTIGENTRMAFGVYLVNFCFGAGIVLWQKQLSIALTNDAPARLLAALALVSTIGIRQIGGWDFDSYYHAAIPTILEGISATMLIAIVVARRGAFSLLRYRPIVWYGDVSYSLYLVHLPLMAFVAGICGEIFHLRLFTGSPLVATACLGICTLTISSGLAGLMFKYIELPGINTGARIMRAATRSN